jgi:N-acetylneuraminic acid mutarotase
MLNLTRTTISAAVAVLLVFISVSTTRAQWVQDATLPMGEAVGSFSFAIGDNVYVGGGIGLKSFYCYNATAKSWTKKADVPGVSYDREFATGFSVGANGYVTLGYDSIQQRMLKDIWEYDTTTDSWSKKSNFPGNARQGAYSFVIGALAYVGSGADQLPNYYPDFYSYDPAVDAWTLIGGGGPAGLVYASTFVIADTGFVVAGANASGEMNMVSAFVPGQPGSWSTRPVFPGSARQAGIGYSLDGKGTVGLGVAYSDPNSPYTDLYTYDPSTTSWTKATSFSTSKRAWATATQTSTAAFVGGGYDFVNLQNAYSDFWELDGISASVSHSIGGSGSDLSVFPNPFSTSFTLHTPESYRHVESIELYDILGRIVFSNATLAANHTFRIDPSAMNLEPGAYFLRVRQGSGISTLPIVYAP